MTKYDQTWQRKFAELEDIAHENGGDPNVAQSHPTHGTWLATQRKAYKAGKLADNRIKALERLGVVWNVHTSSWQSMFEALKVICYENGGNPNVPQNHPTHGMWLTTQRIAYKDGRLADDRVKVLEELGVVWSVNSSWLEMFEALKVIWPRERRRPECAAKPSDPW